MRLCLVLTLALVAFGPSVALSQSKRVWTPPTTKAPEQRRPASSLRVVDPDARLPYLPDTTFLARVADRRLRVLDFRRRYYDVMPNHRSSRDSAGRVEFLKSMMDKEVMGLAALEINRPLTFEDRAKVRAHTRTVLGNVLYQRMVTDSVIISSDELEQVMGQFRYEQHLRSIRVANRRTAEQVRDALAAGKLSWTEAARRHAVEPPSKPDGDLGWVRRQRVKGEFAIRSFDLAPGAPPIVVQDFTRFHVVQCLARRPVKERAELFERAVAEKDLRDLKRRPLVDRFYERVRGFAGAKYDSANIRWAAARFKEAHEKAEPVPANTIDMVGVIPDFSPEDTSRVLAVIKDRRFTLGDFLADYRVISPMVRSDVTDLESFILAMDGPAFLAERMDLALAVGIDKDPLYRAQIDKQREEILVEHLFQDSVVNRVTVTPQMRRDYYKLRQKEFVSIPRVRYARFVRTRQADAESLVSRLKAGVAAEAIMEADSLRGDDTTGTVLEMAQTAIEEYRKILFEELRPGQAATFGPDREGKFLILQLLHYEPERAMSFEEVATIVDESVQNIEAERILKEFLDRRRSRYTIESRPEVVMHIPLTDPADDRLPTIP